MCRLIWNWKLWDFFFFLLFLCVQPYVFQAVAVGSSLSPEALVWEQALCCWLVVEVGGMVGCLNSVPGRKAWSSGLLSRQLPSPWAALGHRFFSFLSGLRVTPPKVDSKQRSTSFSVVKSWAPWRCQLPDLKPRSQELHLCSLLIQRDVVLLFSVQLGLLIFPFLYFAMCLGQHGAARLDSVWYPGPESGLLSTVAMRGLLSTVMALKASVGWLLLEQPRPLMACGGKTGR